MVCFEQVEPTGLVGTGQFHLGPLGQRLIPGEVGGAHRGVLPGLDETLSGVLAGDFEQPESARARFGLQQRLVHQGSEQVENVEALDAAAGAHLPGGFEAETAGEHRQAAQQRPFALGEQVVAPLDHRLKGRLAGRHRPGAPRQQAEIITERRRDLGHGEHVDPGGGQLDGERDPVDSLADRGDRRQFVVAESEVGTSQHRPVGEQTHRCALADRRRGRRRRRQLEWTQPEGLLGGEAEDFPARRQDPHPLAAAQKDLGQLGAGVDDVLAVVEHNQRAPILEVIDEPFHGGPHRAAPWRRIGAGAALAHSELGGHRARHHLAVGDPSQIGKPHPVRERHQHLGGDLHRQPCLARPAGPGDRAQPVGVEQVNQLGDLVSSPDEPSQLYRKVVGTVVQRPERREVNGQGGMFELVEPVRLGQVGEPMDAEIEQLRPGGEAGHGERPGCLGHEHLTAVPGPAHRLRGARRNG